MAVSRNGSPEPSVDGCYRTEGRIGFQPDTRHRCFHTVAVANSECLHWSVPAGFVLGARALLVHHRHQLALQDEPVFNRSADVAVVCAN